MSGGPLGNGEEEVGEEPEKEHGDEGDVAAEDGEEEEEGNDSPDHVVEADGVIEFGLRTEAGSDSGGGPYDDGVREVEGSIHAEYRCTEDVTPWELPHAG